jgi:phosphoglycerate dehydrogenase-like enzyme
VLGPLSVFLTAISDAVAVETSRRLRALSPNCELVYHVPNGIRCHFEDGMYRVHHTGFADLLSTCDVVIPMVPLTPSTAGLINYSSFATMKRSALIINMARGQVVDTNGLLKALKEGLILHAILDTVRRLYYLCYLATCSHSLFRRIPNRCLLITSSGR